VDSTCIKCPGEQESEVFLAPRGKCRNSIENGLIFSISCVIPHILVTGLNRVV
jgi:hypothetical protein